MDHPSKIRKKKKRKTRHKSSKFSEHELKMRSLRGSELSKESNTPMATDTEEVIDNFQLQKSYYAIVFNYDGEK